MVYKSVRSRGGGNIVYMCVEVNKMWMSDDNNLEMSRGGDSVVFVCKE